MILGNCNTANYNNVATWNGVSGNVTTVGSNGNSSYYGTYDQDGNISELLDTKNSSGYPKIRGGNYSSEYVGKSVVAVNDFDAKTSYIGFRVAMSSALSNDGSYVSIGDISNSGDSGLGSVGFTFFMSKYPVTNAEYAAFLNSVGLVRTNTIVQTLYNSNMSNINYRGGIIRSLDGSNYIYTTITNMANKPVNWISWYEAARYINWLYNDKPVGIPSSSTTEDGAYTLSGTNKPNRNNTNKFWIPNENEWYKSAYYDPTLNTGAGGYWNYATQENDTPVSIYANTIGDGDPGSATIDCITPTPTPTVTPTQTLTPTPTITVSNTQTITPTSTSTPTPSITQSLTPTNTITPTVTPTITVTASITPSITVSTSVTPTYTQTPTVTPSNTQTLTPTNTVTPTPSQTTINPIRIGQFIYDGSLYNKDDVILLYKAYKFVGEITSDVSVLVGDQTFVPNISPSPTPTLTNTSTPTPTITPTVTPTINYTPTTTPTNTSTPTITPTHTLTSTNTPTNTLTPTPTVTSSATPTVTPTFNTSNPTEQYSPLALAIDPGGSGVWYSLGDDPLYHSSSAEVNLSQTNYLSAIDKGYLVTPSDYYHVAITNGDNHKYAYWTNISSVNESDYSSLFTLSDSDAWMDVAYYAANNSDTYFLIVGQYQDKMVYTKTGSNWIKQQLPANTNWIKIKAGIIYDSATTSYNHGCCLFTDSSTYYTLTGNENNFVFTQRSLPISTSTIADIAQRTPEGAESKFAIILNDNKVISNINATHQDYVDGTEFAVYNESSSLPNWISISAVDSISDINDNVIFVQYYLLIPDPTSGNTGYYTTDFVNYNTVTLPLGNYTTAKYIKHDPIEDSRIILLTSQSAFFVSRDLVTWTQRYSPPNPWKSLV